MKKKYLKPETKTYVMATQCQLLAGSNRSVDVHSELYDEGNMTDL